MPFRLQSSCWKKAWCIKIPKIKKTTLQRVVFFDINCPPIKTIQSRYGIYNGEKDDPGQTVVYFRLMKVTNG